MARNDADEPNIHSSGIFDELTPLAEIFRSKIIEDFHLLESFDDHGHSDVPKFYSKDLAGMILHLGLTDFDLKLEKERTARGIYSGEGGWWGASNPSTLLLPMNITRRCLSGQVVYPDR